MITDIEKELESIFLSYDRILEKLKVLNITTKKGGNLTEKGLRKAIEIMSKKHPKCRWKSKMAKGYKNYILIEGFYWLKYVYFQNEKKMIDADIEFFITRMAQYEELLQVDRKSFWENDMYVIELEQYFNRKSDTIRKAISKMIKENENYRFKENGKYKISRHGVEWLCKKCFKQKYLELLEDYKMELTEKYIVEGYPYDIFL